MASACVYIECPITKMILGVARKNDSNDWGLPGGKVEEGEREPTAAARELLEETGIQYRPSLLLEIFRREGGVTYRAQLEHADRIWKPKEGEARVQWVTPTQLIFGSFGDYNLRLLKTIGRVKEPEAESGNCPCGSFCLKCGGW